MRTAVTKRCDRHHSLVPTAEATILLTRVSPL